LFPFHHPKQNKNPQQPPKKTFEKNKKQYKIQKKKKKICTRLSV